MKIDLHIHSNFSDGAYSPSELIALAKDNDVQVVALADHDSVSGISGATAAGVAVGIDVIPAVELSVQFNEWRDVHLLGYGIDHSDTLFLRNLDGFSHRREGRNDQILEKVNDALLAEGRTPIERNRVISFAQGVMGRPHIARALLERGYVDNVEDAFRRYLIPCNVPKSYWLIHEAIAEIHRIGGVAVLAHPTSITKDLNLLAIIISDLQQVGLDGIEVFNNMGWPQEIEFLRRLALANGLLMTAGSDYHGIEEGLEIGRGRDGMQFDSSLLAPLSERITRIRSSVPAS